MSVFHSVSQLASWAGVCPGNNEPAGKHRSSRIPKGNMYQKPALGARQTPQSESRFGFPLAIATTRLRNACGG